MYILALIDDTERVEETTRVNNIAVARVHIDCHKGRSQAGVDFNLFIDI